MDFWPNDAFDVCCTFTFMIKFLILNDEVQERTFLV